ncbi:MAG: flagellar protein [Chitinispirillales bacterium]|jgi:flagellar operon protein|nr:flagellar protein [Chitinispirillales bacterium]
MNAINTNSNDIQSRILASRAGLTGRVGDIGVSTPVSKTGESGAVHGKSFSDILKSKTAEELKFSSHASSRLKSRNIEVTPDIMGKLEKAVTEAGNKGARDSLILVKDLAFIVNIPNKTVITAMDGESIRDNVFTNIDSTVIAS